MLLVPQSLVRSRLLYAVPTISTGSVSFVTTKSAASASAKRFNSWFSVLMGNKPEMPSKEEALAGRKDTDPKAPGNSIATTHYVTKNPVKGPFPEGIESVVVGTGCFWGTEKGFWRLPGVFSTSVGYCAGYTSNPTYEEVCSGATGHNEVVLVAWDSSKLSFADILKQFWMSHDPTQGMGQGNDRGTQYRSGLYLTSPSQRALAEESLKAYQTALGPEKTITTEILDLKEFYYAEDYHQQYLAKPGARPYCSAQPTGVHLPDLSIKFLLNDAFWQKHAPRPGCVLREPNEQLPHPGI